MQLNACSVKRLKEDMGPQRPGDSEGPDEQNDLPPEILDIIWPALQVGGASGKQ
jgi:hypothetical protein